MFLIFGKAIKFGCFIKEIELICGVLEALIDIDHQLFVLINSEFSSSILDGILIPLRHKFFWIPFYLFILTYITINFKDKRWLTIVFLLLTVSASDIVSSHLIKKNVQRTRPCHMEVLTPISRIPCSHGFSFTSSHATNHFAIASFLFLLFSSFKWRSLLFLWAGVIGFAQIYTGAHFPLDVFVGSLIGLLIGFLSFKIYHTLVHKFYKIESDYYVSADS